MSLPSQAAAVVGGSTVSAYQHQHFGVPPPQLVAISNAQAFVAALKLTPHREFRADERCFMAQQFRDYRLPLVGLEQMIEIPCSDPSFEPGYYCQACEAKCPAHLAISHLTNQKHLRAFLENVYKSRNCIIWSRIWQEAKQDLDKAARIIELKDGRKQVDLVFTQSLSQPMLSSRKIRRSLSVTSYRKDSRSPSLEDIPLPPVVENPIAGPSVSVQDADSAVIPLSPQSKKHSSEQINIDDDDCDLSFIDADDNDQPSPPKKARLADAQVSVALGSMPTPTGPHLFELLHGSAKVVEDLSRELLQKDAELAGERQKRKEAEEKCEEALENVCRMSEQALRDAEEIEESGKQICDFDRRLKEAQEEKEALAKEVLKLQASSNTAKDSGRLPSASSNDSAVKSRASSCSRCSSLKKELKENDRLIEKVRHERNVEKQLADNLAKRCDKLTEEKKKQEETIEQLSSKFISLKEECEKTKIKFNAISANALSLLEAKRDKQQGEIKTLTKENGKLTTSLEEAEAKLTAMQNGLRTDLADLSAENTRLSGLLQQQLDETNEWKERVTSLENERNLQAQMQTEFEATKSNLDAQITALKNAVRGRDHKLASMDHKMAQFKQLEAAYNHQRNASRHLKVTAGQLAECRRDLEANAAIKAKYEKSLQEAAELRQAKDELQAKFDRERDEITAKFEERSARLENEVATMKEVGGMADGKRHEELSRQLREAKEQCQLLAKEKKTLTGDLTKQKQDAALQAKNHTAAVCKLKEDVAKLEKSQTDFDAIKRELEAQKTEITRLQTELDISRTDLQSADANVSNQDKHRPDVEVLDFVKRCEISYSKLFRMMTSVFSSLLLPPRYSPQPQFKFQSEPFMSAASTKLKLADRTYRRYLGYILAFVQTKSNQFSHLLASIGLDISEATSVVSMFQHGGYQVNLDVTEFEALEDEAASESEATSSGASQRINELSQMKQKLERSNKDLQAQQKETESRTDELLRTQQELNVTSECLAIAESDKKKLEAKLSSVTKELSAEKKRLTENENGANTLEKEVSELSAKLKVAEESLKKSISANKTLEAQLGSASKALDEERAAKQTQVAHLLSEIEKHEDQHTKVAEKQALLDAANVELGTLRQQIATLTSKKDSIQELLEQSRAELVKARRDYAELKALDEIRGESFGTLKLRNLQLRKDLDKEVKKNVESQVIWREQIGKLEAEVQNYRNSLVVSADVPNSM